MFNEEVNVRKYMEKFIRNLWVHFLTVDPGVV